MEFGLFQAEAFKLPVPNSGSKIIISHTYLNYMAPVWQKFHTYEIMLPSFGLASLIT